MQGPAFNADARQADGPVFRWINQLLYPATPLGDRISPGGSLRGQAPEATARAALLGLLSTNSDLSRVFLNQCYTPQPAVSRIYFQARTLAQGRRACGG